MMNYQRYKAECKVLAAKMPANRWGFIWDSMPRLEVILPIAVGGVVIAVHKVKIYGIEDFPEEEPIVTPGMILRDHDGEEMTEPSRANHLLGEYNGETHICLYSEWDPEYSLYKTATRAAVWLAAYYFHTKTGRSVDSYIPH